MVKLVENAIDPSTVYKSISSECSGSVVLHFAVVKEHAGSATATKAINYKPVGDCYSEMNSIASDLTQKWTLEDVLVIRRTGTLAIGEIISLVATSSPNSEDAFEACKHGISLLKKMVTIHKTEISAE